MASNPLLICPRDKKPCELAGCWVMDACQAVMQLVDENPPELVDRKTWFRRGRGYNRPESE
jgi:hypothetical protein